MYPAMKLTMLPPEAAAEGNRYRAMRAVLRVVSVNPEVGRQVFCPGLGTGLGMMPPMQAAREMAEAYADWSKQKEGRT